MLKAQKINGDFLFLFCMDYCDSDVNHFVVACKDFMCVRRRSWTLVVFALFSRTLLLKVVFVVMVIVVNYACEFDMISIC